MLYREYQPVTRLGNLIQCYWFLADHSNERQLSRILPDACVEVILRGQGTTRRRSNRGFVNQERAIAVGQLTEHLELESDGPHEIIGIRFKPHGLSAFTRLPMCDITDSELALDNLWAAFPFDRLWEAQSDCDRRFILDQFFCAQLLADDFDQLRHGQLLMAASLLTVEQVAKQINLSCRQLQRKFKKQIGLSPYQYRRICRLRVLASQLKQKAMPRLTDLAYQLGFSDQAHMNRDFKSYSGLSPLNFRHQQLWMGDVFLGEDPSITN